MARPLRLEFPGALWHVTSRGNDRKNIFFDNADRRFFVDLLGEVVTRYRWILYAWVQMTNHYHLFLQTPDPNLSRGMRDLNGEYAQLLNKRRGRCGHLFQGRFHGILVEREEHFLEITRYVVLNPVRGGIVTDPSAWPWSSYRATAGLVEPPQWLAVDDLLRSFHETNRTEARRMYCEFVASAASRTDSPWKDAVGGAYLGSQSFLHRIEELVREQEPSCEHPRDQRNPRRRQIGEIVDDVRAAVAGLPEGMHPSDAKALVAFFARAAAVPLKQTAEWLGVSASHVSRLAGRGEFVARRFPGLQEQITGQNTRPDPSQ